MSIISDTAVELVLKLYTSNIHELFTSRDEFSSCLNLEYGYCVWTCFTNKDITGYSVVMFMETCSCELWKQFTEVCTGEYSTYWFVFMDTVLSGFLYRNEFPDIRKYLEQNGPTPNPQYVNTSDVYQVQQSNEIWNKWFNPATTNPVARCTVYNPSNDTLNAASYIAQYPTMLTAPTGPAVYTSLGGWRYHYCPTLTSFQDSVRTVGGANFSTISVNQGLTSWGVPGYGPSDALMSGKTNVINVANIPELNSIVTNADGSITVGAGIKYTKLSQTLMASSNQVYSFIGNWIRVISGWQVRNRGAWVGATCMAKEGNFQSDLTLMMITLGVTLNIWIGNVDGTSSIVTMTTQEFLNYNFGSSIYLIISGTFSATANHMMFGYRVAKRLYQSHNLGEIAVLLTMNNGVISAARSFVGGLGANVNAGYQQWTQGEQYLVGKSAAMVDPIMLVNIARTTPWSIHVDYVPQYSSVQSETNYFKEIMNGHVLHFVNDLKGNVDNMALSKTTAWGSQQYGTPEGQKRCL